MESNKNRKVLIVIGVLLVLVVGVSLAYFIGSILISGNGASTSGRTANVKGATIEVIGNLEFNDLDILPGHKNVSGITVKATGAGEFVAYNLIWKGTNTLNTPLKYYVYKSNTTIDVTSSCETKREVLSGQQIIREECSISNESSLGSVISEGNINKSEVETKVTIVDTEFITASAPATEVYYYVVLEYPNLDESQNIDIGGSFAGELTIEANEAKADININRIYLANVETSTLPSKTDGYVFNEESSTCTNNATPSWDNEAWSLQVNNLNQSGTDCNLYFDKPKSADTIAKLNITNITEQTDSVPNFASAATSNEGVFKTSDGMYGGDTYYFRGAADNNHVIFADLCWKIIRINGDGSIRMIYNGVPENGVCKQTSDETSIAVKSQAYNLDFSMSYHVGWTYETGKQRPDNNLTATPSNIKSQTDSWYQTNITDKGFDDSVATGKFCNDRNLASGSSWTTSGSTFDYAGYDRSGAKSASSVTPVTTCPEGDVYEMKAGVITMDEVVMAGGKWSAGNSSYYLYNGRWYWTMSPYEWHNSAKAYAFLVRDDGQLWINIGVTALGVRPVINLLPSTTFKTGGNGQANTPFIAE